MIRRALAALAGGEVARSRVGDILAALMASTRMTPPPPRRDVARVAYYGPIAAFRTVGTHPQFRHLDTPPDGYDIVLPGRPRVARAVRVALAILRLAAAALVRGERPRAIWRFVRSRGLRTELCVPAGVALGFVPTMPYVLGAIPWVIEIEDVVPLFYPFLLNGETATIAPRDIPYFGFVKSLLESKACRAIVCHVKSTADSLPILFGSERIGAKTVHLPLGIPAPPPIVRPPARAVTRLLFTNSWHQHPTNFYLRGGVDVLEAFAVLAARYPHVELVLRTALPDDLDERYRRIIAGGRVEVLGGLLPDADLQALRAGCDVCLLPAARIHVVSILEAMAYGNVLVTSDGWAIEEYVEHGRNGLIVKGRYGKVSWVDGGLLREDYRSLRAPDPVVVDGLVRSVSELIERPEVAERIRRQARSDIDTRFGLERWNAGLKAVFDQACA